MCGVLCTVEGVVVEGRVSDPKGGASCVSQGV